jgi:hypothetical protein
LALDVNKRLQEHNSGKTDLQRASSMENNLYGRMSRLDIWEKKIEIFKIRRKKWLINILSRGVIRVPCPTDVGQAGNLVRAIKALKYQGLFLLSGISYGLQRL